VERRETWVHLEDNEGHETKAEEDEHEGRGRIKDKCGGSVYMPREYWL